MGKTTRAKFVCNSVKMTGYGSFDKDGNRVIYKQQIVECSAVQADGTPENNLYNTASPSGSFGITIDNPQAFDTFEPGEYYYLDITKVPAPTPPEAPTAN